MNAIPHPRHATAGFSSARDRTLRRDTIVIGASAGGVAALQRLLRALPAELPAAVLVVLHQPSGRSELADVLGTVCALPVERVDSARPLLAGRVYVAPPDRHMVVAGDRVTVTDDPHERRARPAIDPLFRTAAAARGARVVAVQLTGMLDDGVAGLLAVSRCGGRVLVQDPEEAAHAEMPLGAIEAVPVDHVAGLDELATLLRELVHERVPETRIPRDIALEARLAVDGSDGDEDGGLRRSLLVAVRALEERISTLERLAAGGERSRPAATAAYRERAAESRDHAERLKRFLMESSEAPALAETGRVAPELGAAPGRASGERPRLVASAAVPGKLVQADRSVETRMS